MTAKTLEIERQAVRLPAKDREALVERLILSLGKKPLTDIDEAWVKEAERRFTSWRRGERAGIPAGRALRKIRQDLGW